MTPPDAARCLVMGVVNVTPDSFSDGGRWKNADAAIARGFELAAQGSDIVDVGGESTRPGALRIDETEELRRVIPVVRELAGAGLRVSVDTMRAEVAHRALAVGAKIVNDVSGGRADPNMRKVAAESGAPFVVMHWRQHSQDMQSHTAYDNVVRDVINELGRQIDDALAAGISEEQIIVDPGLGFSKTGDHNWTILANLSQFMGWGYPLLIAASRKGFLGTLLASDDGPRPVDQREAATVAISTLAAQAGAWCVRVHEPAGSVDALRVVARLRAEAVVDSKSAS